MNNYIHLKHFLLRDPIPLGAAKYNLDWVNKNLTIQEAIDSILAYSEEQGTWGIINIGDGKYTSGYGYGKIRDWHEVENNIPFEDKELMKKTIYSGNAYVDHSEMNYYLELSEDISK